MNAIRNEIVSLFKSSLHKDSKFYEQDLADFKRTLAGKSESEAKEQLARLRALSGLDAAFNNTVSKEMDKLDKSGMFSMHNMKPTNALD